MNHDFVARFFSFSWLFCLSMCGLNMLVVI